MPRLENYTAELGGTPVNGGRRADAQDFGAEGWAQVARVGNVVANLAQEEQSRREEDEVRQVMLDSVKLEASYQEKLVAAENEPNVDLDKLHEEFQNDTESLAQNTQYGAGLATARTKQAQLDAQFTRGRMAVTASREKSKAVAQVSESIALQGKRLSAAPGMLEFAAAEHDQLIDTFRGIPEALRSQLKVEGRNSLTVGAVQSMIQADPVGAKDALNDPDNHTFDALTPEQRATETRRADIAIEGLKSDAERDYIMQQRAQKKADDDAMGAMLADFGANKMGEWNSTRILKMDDITPGARLDMVRVLDHYGKRAEEKGDGVGFNKLYKGIVAGTAKRPQLDEALFANRITPQDHSSLMRVLAGEDKPETQMEAYFFSRMDQSIMPRDAMGRMMGGDQGAVNSVKFKQDVWAIKEQFVKDGKDPSPLFDPGTREFQTHVAPLLSRYRAKTWTIYNADGSVQTVTPPGIGAESAVKVRDQAGYDTLAPGEWFEWNGRVGQKPHPKPSAKDTRVPGTNPAQAEKGVREQPLHPEQTFKTQEEEDAAFRAMGVMDAPAAPYSYPPSYIPDESWRGQ